MTSSYEITTSDIEGRVGHDAVLNHNRFKRAAHLAFVLIAAIALPGAHAFATQLSTTTRAPQGTAFLSNPESDIRSYRTTSSQLMYQSYAADLSNTDFTDNRNRNRQADFNQRMRDAALGGQNNNRRRKQMGAGLNGPRKPSNIKLVETLEDYKATVADETDRIVVVRFFAPWCRACRAAAQQFYRMAETNPSLSFVEVPVSPETAALHQGLGVPSIPFGHVYHPTGGLVEEMKVTRQVFKKFATKVQSYVKESCDIPVDGDCSNPYVEKLLDDDDV